MDLKPIITECQAAVGTKADGLPGEQTWRAIYKALKGKEYEAPPSPETYVLPRGSAEFDVTVEGEDLWVRGVKATCFGGDSDAMDSGATASGFSTKGHGGFKGVALPLRYTGHNGPTREALGESPIPTMPFGVYPNGNDREEGAHVELFHNGQSCGIHPCIDLGPNLKRFPKNAIDLTIALARVIDPNATANNFESVVDYRIIGAAKYIQKA